MAVDLTQAVPNLWSLEVYYDLDTLKVDWENLKSLVLKRCNRKFVLEKTRLCTRLKRLGLYECPSQDEGGVQINPPSFILPDLVSLTLDSCSERFLEATLPFLTLPLLSTVKIFRKYYYHGDAGYSLSSLFLRSRCSISTLQLEMSSLFPIPDISSFIDACPLLHELAVKFRPVGAGDYVGIDPPSLNQFFDLLHAPKLPHLQTLEVLLNFPLEDGFIVGSFASMVQSRWYTAGKKMLFSVSLDIGGNAVQSISDSATWGILKQMRQEGLQIQVKDANGFVQTRIEAEECANSEVFF